MQHQSRILHRTREPMPTSTTRKRHKERAGQEMAGKDSPGLRAIGNVSTVPLLSHKPASAVLAIRFLGLSAWLPKTHGTLALHARNLAKVIGRITEHRHKRRSVIRRRPLQYVCTNKLGCGILLYRHGSCAPFA